MRFQFLLLLGVLLAAAYGDAAPRPEIELPRKWAGTYTSHQALDDDYFQITINQVLVNGNIITAKGQAKYFDDGYIADLQVEWIIDTESLFIEMWDFAPENDADNYDVEGTYQGSISYELDTIFAIWRNWTQTYTGTLRLEAVEEFPDYAYKSRKKN